MRLIKWQDTRTIADVGGIALYDSTGGNQAFLAASTKIGTEFNQQSGLVSGGDVQAWLNGAAGVADTIDGDGATTNDYTRVFNDFGDANQFNGDIAELLIYDTDLSETDRQSVEAYLKAKWDTP